MIDLPDLDHAAACYFDFDGTLVELAPRPDAVVVPPGVTATLERLAERLDGAVAVVTGRQAIDIDRFLAPLRLPVAGVHGAERRSADGRWIRAPAPDLRAAIEWLRGWTRSHPGSWLEEKGTALALHFRGADALEQPALDAMRDARTLVPGTPMVVLRGKKLVELAMADATKGRAVQAFGTEAPFLGRRPWYFGDDVTDESAFAEVRAQRGVTVMVGDGVTVAEHRIDAPAALRGWLERQLAHQSGSGR